MLICCLAWGVSSTGSYRLLGGARSWCQNISLWESSHRWIFPDIPAMHVCSVVFNFATPWAVALQAPLSMDFPRQDYWSVLPFSSPVDHILSDVQKRCPFHYRGWECKSKKSRNTWSSRHIWPWSTKQSRSKANRVLPRERSGHSKHPLPKTQENTLHMEINRWSTLKSDWLYSLQPKMTVIKNKTRNWLWLRS